MNEYVKAIYRLSFGLFNLDQYMFIDQHEIIRNALRNSSVSKKQVMNWFVNDIRRTR